MTREEPTQQNLENAVLTHNALLKMVCLAFAAAGLLAGTHAQAGSIIDGEYVLLDHPNGGVRPPLYGLRLDGLLDGNAGTETTFSFDPSISGVGMKMIVNYDASEGFDSFIQIIGTMSGGIDTGSAIPNPELFFVNATYRNVKMSSDSLIVDSPDDPQFIGTVTRLSNNEQWNLASQESSAGFSFLLDKGHRISNDNSTITGHGWVNYYTDPSGIGTHVYASDWLFTAELVQGGEFPVIPSPAALGAGLLGIGLLTLRRRNA